MGPAQEEGCFASAGSRQILSKQLKGRSRQKAQEKQEPWRGQEIEDKEAGEAQWALHWALAATLLPLSSPAGWEDRAFLFISLKKEFMSKERECVLYEQRLPRENLWC